jgi:hypothetical protein
MAQPRGARKDKSPLVFARRHDVAIQEVGSHGLPRCARRNDSGFRSCELLDILLNYLTQRKL